MAAAIVLAATCASALGSDTEAIFETAGRTHMALVHFPIALIVAAVLFELVRILTGRDRPSPAALGCLFIASVGAAAAATTGWWHADFDGRTGEDLVELHRWVAIAGGSLAVLALVMGLSALGGDRRMLRRLYVLVVVLAAGTITVAGHQGGEIVYGEGYVFEPLMGEDKSEGPADPVAAVPDRPLPTVVSFERDLLPVFEANCIECHGAREQKGKLRLDSFAALAESPYFSEVVVAGDAARSALYERITLPKTDRDFMPKRGEPLSAWEISAIRLWIETRAADAHTGPADAGEPDGAPLEPAAEQDTEAHAVIAAVAARGGHAALESAQSNRLVVNLSVLSRPIMHEDLAVLEPVAERIIELNLGGAGVTGAMAPAIGRFTGLERLNLSRSDIMDGSLTALASLERLRVLNLYGSSVTNGGIDAIAALPALERVYIWRTFIDAEGVERLQSLRPGLEVIAGAEAAEPEKAPDDAPADIPDGEASPEADPAPDEGDGG